MIVLGVGSFIGGHDASAALVIDGRLVAAAEEERFTRVKHQGGVPIEAIRFCLHHAGVDIRDVDRIAIPDLPFRTGRDSQMAGTDRAVIESLYGDGLVRRRAIWHKRLLDATPLKRLPLSIGIHPEIASGLERIREEFGVLPPAHYFGHHESHAASAFFQSDSDQASILSVDGRGANYSTVIWAADRAGIRSLWGQSYANSLGKFFSDCTNYLGFGELSEGKTMGLASYGDPERLGSAIASMLRTDQFPYRYQRAPSAEVIGLAPRGHADPIDQNHKDFAAGAQHALERALSALTAHATTLGRHANLCIAGGVALNCSANGKIVRARPDARTFVYPAAGDAGLSVGAALLATHAYGQAVEPGATPYLGPGASSDEVERELVRRAADLVWSRGEVAHRAAVALSNGAAIGWFQGRMEIGPRALGARSILADPRHVETRDRVNRLKGRELWRPLAPVVLAEHAAEYFELACESPYMLLAVPVRSVKRATIAATVHVDGTARPQTVGNTTAPRLRELLVAFRSLTGVPVLLNTSFNTAREPIVNTPADAVRSFLEMRLDALVMEDYFIQSREQCATTDPQLRSS